MLVLATSASMTEASQEARHKVQEEFLLPSIHYSSKICEFLVEALSYSGSKVNEIELNFIRKLSLPICKTDVGAFKIINDRLETYKIVNASFQMYDNDGMSRIFEQTFLFADFNMNVAFGMFFLTLSNVEVNSKNREF